MSEDTGVTSFPTIAVLFIMSSQRPIKDEMWSDDWFYDLDPSEKLMWVFLLTNDRQNVAGVFKANQRWISANTGFDRQVVEMILSRFEETDKIRREDDWIIVTNHYKHQSLSPKIESGIKRVLSELPENVFLRYPMDRVCIRYRTLLNFTLPNLSEGAAEAAENNKKDMSWKDRQYAEDYIEEEIQADPDFKAKKAKKSGKATEDQMAVFELFNNPAKGLWRMRELEREAAQILLDTYGLETIEKRIKRIEQLKKNNDPYLPQVDTPSELLDKMPKVERYLKL